MNGTRKDFDSRLPGLHLEPGDYGKDHDGRWACCVPKVYEGEYIIGNRLIGSLAGHDVTEHEDGTITVSPSILIKLGNVLSWHGYLERGVWREC